MDLPLYKPERATNELSYLERSLASGDTGGGGPFSDLTAERLSAVHDGAPVLMTPSCTAALELAALVLDLGPGDEVIVPSYTHPSTAAAFARTGATVVFVDIEPETLGVDPAAVADAIGARTRAVVPVHYAGVPCRITEIVRAAAARDVAVVEDNAHGLFGALDGRPLGGFGDLSTLSFHVTKNFSCGEGGALVVNDPDLLRSAEVVQDMGTDRKAWTRGEVRTYTWQRVGSSFRLADPLAALLLAQLEQVEEVQTSRRACFDRYQERLAPEMARTGITLPVVPAGALPAAHFHWLLLDRAEQRDDLVAALRAEGIGAAPHYPPLHLSRAAATTARRTTCPVTESVAARVVRLPLTASMTVDDVDRVADTVVRALAIDR